MKKIIILLLALALPLFFMAAAKTPAKAPKNTFYKPDFAFPKTVEKNARAMLDRSLPSDPETAVKALIQIIVSQSAVSSDSFSRSMQLSDSVARLLPSPWKNVVRLLQSRAYYEYYNSEFTFRERRLPADGPVPNDVAAWSANMFANKIMQLTQEALSPADELQKCPIATIKGVLKGYTDRTEKYMPWVYDFLAEQALEYLSPFTDSRTVIPFTTNPENLSTTGAKASVMRSNIYSSLLTANAGYDDALALSCRQQASLKGSDAGPFLFDALQKLKDSPASLIILQALAGYVTDDEESINPDQKFRLSRKEFYALCSEAVSRFPDADYTNAVKQCLLNMNRVNIQITPQSNYKAGGDVRALLKSSNATDFYVLLVKVADSDAKTYVNNKAIRKGQIIASKHISLNGTVPFTDTLSVVFPDVSSGYYAIVPSTSASMANVLGLPADGSSSLIRVGNLSAFTTYSSTGTMKPVIYVVDVATAKPAPGIAVKQYADYYPDRDKLIKSGKTNNEGAVEIADNRTRMVIGEGNEKFVIGSYSYSNNSTPVTNVCAQILTDRSVYHPADTVGFSVILYKNTGNDNRPLPRNAFKVSLRNVNNTVVDTLRLTTDEYGRASGKLILPKDGVLGNNRILIEKEGRFTASESVMVAEYKAPTFFVELDSIAPDYQPGQEISIGGFARTYSGMPVANANVDLQITYRPLRWWFYGGDEASYGTSAKTDGNGRFIFTLPTANLQGTRFANGVFEVKATATSQAGESQESEAEFFCLGNAYRMDISIPSRLLISEKPLKGSVKVMNAAGTQQALKVNYAVTNTADNKEVAKGSFLSPAFELPVEALKSGKYKFCFTLDADTTVKAQREIVLYRTSDKQPPFATALWLPETSVTASLSAKSVKITVGESYKGAILCQIASDKGLISRQWVYPAGKNIQIEAPVPADNSRTFVSFTATNGFNITTKTVTIEPYSAKEALEVEVVTFRDKLVPNTPEKWTFRFRNTLQKETGHIPAFAVMTDKALNAICPFSWSMYLSEGYYSPLQVNSYNLPYASWSYAKRGKSLDVFRFSNPRIYTYNRSLYSAPRKYYLRGKMAMATGSVANLMAVQDEAKEAEAAPMYNAALNVESAHEANDEGRKIEPKAEVQTTSQQETWRAAEYPVAFFKPTLLSDSNGNLDISFLVPDFNTTWQFQLLGYDSTLNLAQTTKFAVASKPVMVQMTAPRFLRTGDKVELRATVYNNSEEEQNIKASFNVVNPFTNSLVAEPAGSEITLPANGSGIITSIFTVPADVQMVMLQARATAGRFTDGEQVAVGILPSSEPVTEATDFYLDPAQKEFSIQLPQYKDGEVTLQYCNNPVWYCLTALPEISEPKSDNLLSLIYAYFGNALSSGLANQYPVIREALTLCSNDKSSDSPLISALQRNSQLKTLALENTVWLQNAQGETMRMAQLINLLDTATNRATQQRIIAKIKNLQTPEGGWQWMPQMDPSLYLTSNVLLYLGQLKQMNCLPSDAAIKPMTEKALSFCDKEVLDIYNRSVRRNEPFPLNTMLSYFYIRSFYQQPAKGDLAKLSTRTMQNLRKKWRILDVYDLATAAMLLHRSGDDATSKLILESLRQHTSSKPGKGIWFDNIRSAFNSGGTLLCTAQVLEAFAEIEPKAAEIDGIRQWLVVQRQAQDWGDNRNLSEVIHAILTSGTNWTRPSDPAVVSLDGKVLKPSRFQTLTGEFVMPLNAAEASAKVLSIEKPGDNPSWGGVISKFIQPVAEVKDAKVEDLSITKDVYVIRVTDAGEQAIRTDSLKVGDRVRVTLTLTAGRDLEYVAVTDQRAACMEPADQLPHYSYQDGAGYYYEPRNSQTNFFINYLLRGVHTLTYDCYVQQSGHFALGIATAQSQYAPLIVAHSSGQTLQVAE